VRREILIHAGVGETRIATLEDGLLSRLQGESLLTEQGARIGDIILGRVTRVMPAMQAAFVAIGTQPDGFLAFRDARSLAPQAADISRSVQEGQEILVRITREAVGEKGPRLAALLPDALPEKISIARKSAKPPATLSREPDLIIRTLRDHAGEASRIVIDGATGFAAARDFCRAALPQIADRIALFAGPGALFDTLEEEIDGLSRPRVALASGAWIAIEPTEGFTAIDINSGSFAASASREETSFAVNLDAAREIGRQIALRDLGGLIVADFIQLAGADNHRKIRTALEASLAAHGVAAQISALPELGLVAIACRKTRSARQAQTHETCPACDGAGYRCRVESVALAILRAVERAAGLAPGKPVLVRAAPDVVARLEARGAAIHAGLAGRGLARLSFRAESSFARERFDVGTGP
jgi:ribonuclease G